MHFRFVVGKRVGLGAVEAVGDGSRHISPNHAFDVQLWDVVAAGVDEDIVDEGVGEVDVGSLQPNQPGVSQLLDDV